MQTQKIDDRFTVSGQIDVSDVEAIRESGFGIVVCNRPDAEEPGQVSAAEIRAACDRAGVEFHHLPISGGELTPETLRTFRRILEQATTPILAYCRSGQRSRMLHQAAIGAR